MDTLERVPPCANKLAISKQKTKKKKSVWFKKKKKRATAWNLTLKWHHSNKSCKMTVRSEATYIKQKEIKRILRRDIHPVWKQIIQCGYIITQSRTISRLIMNFAKRLAWSIKYRVILLNFLYKRQKRPFVRVILGYAIIGQFQCS